MWPRSRACGATVEARDRALGGRRPQQVMALLAAIEAKLEAAREYQLHLEHYAAVRRDLLAYERRVRPAFATLDGLKSVMAFIRDMKSMAFERLVRADTRLQAMSVELARVTPPSDLAEVHATLLSAIHMSVQATSRRRLAVAAISMSLAREASTAAAGAELLLAQTRELLARRLFPPVFAER